VLGGGPRRGQKKSTLKEWCRGFKLPISGNLNTLRERLEAFSDNPKAWEE
jgi:hypothetical protein